MFPVYFSAPERRKRNYAYVNIPLEGHSMGMQSSDQDNQRAEESIQERKNSVEQEDNEESQPVQCLT